MLTDPPCPQAVRVLNCHAVITYDMMSDYYVAKIITDAAGIRTGYSPAKRDLPPASWAIGRPRKDEPQDAVRR
jgi:hypothetical protein